MIAAHGDVGQSALGVDQELPTLFHTLNNQLGIILAQAELIETKAGDSASRDRAALVVASVLDAMGTARQIRRRRDR